jgi:hypothetical protein
MACVQTRVKFVSMIKLSLICKQWHDFWRFSVNIWQPYLRKLQRVSGAAWPTERTVHSPVNHRVLSLIKQSERHVLHCSAVLPPSGTIVKTDCHLISLQTKDTQTVPCLCEIWKDFMWRHTTRSHNIQTLFHEFFTSRFFIPTQTQAFISPVWLTLCAMHNTAKSVSPPQCQPHTLSAPHTLSLTHCQPHTL